jgi:hypothetical protein
MLGDPYEQAEVAGMQFPCDRDRAQRIEFTMSWASKCATSRSVGSGRSFAPIESARLAERNMSDGLGSRSGRRARQSGPASETHHNGGIGEAEPLFAFQHRTDSRRKLAQVAEIVHEADYLVGPRSTPIGTPPPSCLQCYVKW